MRVRTQATARWAASLLLLGGCSTQHFRERADKDVEAVIGQKNLFPDWKVENWHVYPDPRARFADPFSPDSPPYPPDDYAAWLTAPNPQRPGRGGAGRHEGDGYLKQIIAWDAENRAEDEARLAAKRQAEPDLAGRIGTGGTGTGADAATAPSDPRLGPPTDPSAKADATGAAAGGTAAYLATFATNERPYRITMNQAVELAIFNSREFQDRREDLYLAALPVTLERFNFAAQAFAAENIIRQSTGRDYPGGGGEAWRINTDATVSRNIATGGQLIVRLANQIVVDLSGPSPQVSLSNLSLTFIQPLLRGGGYAVTLESLTQAERSLLYAIRSYARFRRVFYAALVGQGSSIQGQGGGGASGGYTNNPYGLQGLSTNLGRGIGANLTAVPNGFFSTVLQSATLANQRQNVVALEQFLKLFQNLQEGGAVSGLQVGRVEQNLINSRIQVLTSTRAYLDSVDNFKLQLGVPTTLPLELDDGPLRAMRTQLERFEALFADAREVAELGGKFDPAEPVDQLRTRWGRILTESSLARGTTFSQQYLEAAAALRRLPDDALTARAADLIALRRKRLDLRADRQLKNQPEPPSETADLEAIEAALDRLSFEQTLRRYEARPWLAAPPERRANEQIVAARAVLDAGLLVAAQARTERLTKVRDTWPALPSVVIDGMDVLTLPLDEAAHKTAQAALTSRLDLMNARAQVVDGWRQIAVTANALQGVFDVRYDLNTTTPRDEAAGLAFAGTRTQHAVTLNVQPPFVRRAERNAYRAALIGYQRSRRNLMAFEDNILADSRSDLRQLRQLAVSYRLQQRAIELAYAQVDNARSTLTAPPDPTARDTAAAQAALTEQLLSAQQALVQAQNTLYTTWMAFQATRIDYHLDLERLPLDARGLWNDDTASQPLPGPAAPAAPPVGGERAPAPQPVPGPGPAAKE